MNLKRTELLLVSIVLIGAALRIRSLWFQLPDADEYWTLNTTYMPVAGIVKFSLLQDFNPPLFYLAAKLSAAILGASIVAVRVPSMVASTLLIPVGYYIGKEAQDELTGLTLAGFTALLYPLVFYSQYARSFAMAGLFMGIAIYGFIRVMNRDRGQWLFIGAGLLAIYTHAFTIIPLLALGAYLWVKHRLPWKNIAIAAVLAVPYGIMMYTIAMSRHANYGLTPEWVASVIPWEMFGYILPVVVVLVIASWLWYRNEFTGVFTVVPLLVAFFAVGVSWWTPVFPRYALSSMPMLFLVAVVPLAQGIRSRNPWVLPVVTLIGVLNVVQIAALWYVQHGPRLG